MEPQWKMDRFQKLYFTPKFLLKKVLKDKICILVCSRFSLITSSICIISKQAQKYAFFVMVLGQCLKQAYRYLLYIQNALILYLKCFN